ncbi:unnamed protein product [Ilex paraguariensis]|uniref:Uncharacterized protein n=1 Tax=Ilex paraguariensis TaxID=185542 RepID=A0ABC8RA08_9AQUA
MFEYCHCYESGGASTYKPKPKRVVEPKPTLEPKPKLIGVVEPNPKPTYEPKPNPKPTGVVEPKPRPTRVVDPRMTRPMSTSSSDGGGTLGRTIYLWSCN